MRPALTITEQERQVLVGVREGETTWDTASRIEIGESWVRRRRQELRRRFGAPSLAAAVIYAQSAGLLDPDSAEPGDPA